MTASIEMSAKNIPARQIIGFNEVANKLSPSNKNCVEVEKDVYYLKNTSIIHVFDPFERKVGDKRKQQSVKELQKEFAVVDSDSCLVHNVPGGLKVTILRVRTDTLPLIAGVMQKFAEKNRRFNISSFEKAMSKISLP